MSLSDNIKWNEQGLVAAIAQDWQTGEVLMMAWMNAESLQLTLQEQRAVYWSRSRAALWRKGEESGNVQHLKELRVDCDGDTVLMQVEQVGGIACHTGRRSCFYRVAAVDGTLATVDEVLRDPQDLYGAKGE
ncbi:phosphoribosyl-AMP cyclohydrolase [Haliea sp. E17]|uniref:phosphoribosyl-AMP cyclohydrolase n=1 Tax=Haliea sp. E17 TaxID=3401576 RepID=UPI003AAF4ADF